MTGIAELAGPFALARQDAPGEQGCAAQAATEAHVESMPGAQPKVAYFTNVYPKISHSFIRTEILALERRGFAVSRFSVRRSGECLGAEDQAESEKTEVLLGYRAEAACAVVSAFLSTPRAAVRALALARRTAAGARRGRFKACAYFAEAALLSRRLRQLGIRHVHAHFGTNPAAVVRLAARLAPITYSFTAHGPDEFDDPRGLDLGGKIAEAAFVAGVSSYGRGQLMRWAATSDWPRIHVVRCAAGPGFFERACEIDAPASLPQAPHFLCVARLSAQKGLPLLIESIAMVSARRAVTLDIIGDGEDRAVIEEQIARSALTHRVRLLGWAGPETIRLALQNARALVLPSFAEGLPVVLMEAMASRRPVIATAVAGIPELVDREVGWLVPSGSAQALAEALEAALDAAPGRLAAMGEQGRLRVLERHDPDRNAAELAALLGPLAQAEAH